MAQLVEPPPDPLLGRTIAGGHYRIDEFQSVDDIGRIYLGTHARLDRRVEIKILPGSQADDAQLVEKFQRAGLAASRVRHPNVLEVFDLGKESDGSLYLVQEHLEGVTLDAIASPSHPLTPRRTIEIMSQVASGLGAAHRAGVVHRDVRPDNVILFDQTIEDGERVEQAKILSFGVAKMEEIPQGTNAGKMTIEMLSGTPEFLSPEQCNGSRPDARSDVYACGCIAYYLVTGVVPFDGVLLQVLISHLKMEPRPPSDLRSGIPAELEQVILKALAKNPDDRYQTGCELAAALQRALPACDRIAAEEPLDSDDAENESVDLDIQLESRPAPAPTVATPQQSAPPRAANQASDEALFQSQAKALQRRRLSGDLKLLVVVALLAIGVGIVSGLMVRRSALPDAPEQESSLSSWAAP